MIFGITDRTLYEDEAVYLNKIDSFLASESINYLILRDKSLDVVAYDALLQSILERNKIAKQKLIVHTHAPLAFKYGIDRIHMPEKYIDDQPFQREITRMKAQCPIQVGYSIHPKNYEDGQVNVLADYLMISPVMETTCKPEVEPLDEQVLTSFKAMYGDKLILLGGMNKQIIESYKSKGYSHFALRSGVEKII